VAVALCACGDNVELPRGGARLKLVDYVFTDGTRINDRATFYDSVLEDRCRAAQFADGERYCMPVSAGAEVRYVDDQCTMPLGHIVDPLPASPAYFIAYDEEDGLAHPAAIYRAGDTSPLYASYGVRDGRCQELEVTGTVDYFTLTRVIGPGDLAHFEETSRLDGSRVQVGVDATDDGLLALGAFRDGACIRHSSTTATGWHTVGPALPVDSFATATIEYR
jgi:hypothetical protein